MLPEVAQPRSGEAKKQASVYWTTKLALPFHQSPKLKQEVRSDGFSCDLGHTDSLSVKQSSRAPTLITFQGGRENKVSTWGVKDQSRYEDGRRMGGI